MVMSSSHRSIQSNNRLNAALDRMADVIKDAMMDGFGMSRDEDDQEPFSELPPMSVDEFIEVMRGPVDEALRQAAEAINEIPEGLSTEAEERTCDIFTELWLESLRVAMRLRIDEALANDDPTAARPLGEWARRYRRMLASGMCPMSNRDRMPARTHDVPSS
jgi:hypothetical protein